MRVSTVQCQKDDTSIQRTPLRATIKGRSVLILGSGAENFWQEYETFSIILGGGVQSFKSNFYGV